MLPLKFSQNALKTIKTCNIITLPMYIKPSWKASPNKFRILLLGISEKDWVKVPQLKNLPGHSSFKI